MTKADKVLISILVVVSVISMVGIFYSSSDVEEKYVVINVNNVLVEKILIDNTTKASYSFTFENNVGRVEIENGAVRMEKMDKKICPNGICSDTGWISQEYQSIVCLPNIIVVTIEQNQDTEIDIVS